jgi:hypothetical protein
MAPKAPLRIVRRFMGFLVLSAISAATANLAGEVFARQW